jgi:hypothetical protein
MSARTSTHGEWLGVGLEGLRRRAEGRTTPVPLPFPDLARHLGGGLWPGLTVLTGPVGSGKTQLSVQLALHAAQRGARVLIAAPGLGAPEAAARVAGLLEGRPWGALLDPTDDDTRRHLLALALPRDLRLELHQGSLATPDLHAATRLLRQDERGSPMLAILEPDREPLEVALAGARMLAQSLEAAVLLVLAPTRHAPESSTGTRREGPPERQLERLGLDVAAAATADAVLALLPREAAGRAQGRPFDLALAKARAGVPAWLSLRFDGTTFTEEAKELDLSL